MRLKTGDKIICFKPLGKNLTIGKIYPIVHIREGLHGGAYMKDDFKMKIGYDDICIIGDNGINRWFGQEDNTEPWTMWFITESQWREKKIELIENEE